MAGPRALRQQRFVELEAKLARDIFGPNESTPGSFFFWGCGCAGQFQEVQSNRRPLFNILLWGTSINHNVSQVITKMALVMALYLIGTSRLNT